MGIRWTTPLTTLNVARYAQELTAGVHTLARETAFAMEANAKVNAPWNDDTGAARAGLRGSVEVAGALTRIVLAQSVAYGRYLEFAHGGRFAILWPTVEAERARLLAALQQLVGR